jgi:hypothetical protein
MNSYRNFLFSSLIVAIVGGWTICIERVMDVAGLTPFYIIWATVSILYCCYVVKRVLDIAIEENY